MTKAILAEALIALFIGGNFVWNWGADAGYQAGWQARIQFDRGAAAPANWQTWHATP